MAITETESRIPKECIEADELNLLEAIDGFLETVTGHHNVTSGGCEDGLAHCHLCGEWDHDHAKDCPVPGLRAWAERHLGVL